MKENEKEENTNNSNSNNTPISSDSTSPPDLLNDEFFSVIKTSKKINDKRKKIDDLAKSLEENPSFLKSPQNEKKISDLYNLLISNLNENNNNYVSSQINLIEILINNNKDINNNKNFKDFSKMALPKLFDKYYLQNQKINESLTGVLGKFIDNKILNIQDYYPHIENISLEEEDNYKNNIMNLLTDQFEKNKEITRDKIPKGIIDIVNRLTEDEDETVSIPAKKSLNILYERKPEINNTIKTENENEKNKDSENAQEKNNVEEKINNNENMMGVVEESKEENKEIEKDKEMIKDDDENKNEYQLEMNKSETNSNQNNNENTDNIMEENKDINKNFLENNNNIENKELKEKDINMKEENRKNENEIGIKEINEEKPIELPIEDIKEEIKKEIKEEEKEEKEEKMKNEEIKEHIEENDKDKNIQDIEVNEKINIREEDKIKDNVEINENINNIENENKKEENEIDIKKENKDINNNFNKEKEKVKIFDEGEENQITEIPEIKIEEDLLNIDNINSNIKENLANQNIDKEKMIQNNEINKENNTKININNNENENIIKKENIEKETSQQKKTDNEEKKLENKNEIIQKDKINEKNQEESISDQIENEDNNKMKNSKEEISKANENKKENEPIKEDKIKKDNQNNNIQNIEEKNENENIKKEENKEIINNEQNNINDIKNNDDQKKEITKQESNNEINENSNINNNQEVKKEGGVKRSAIQGKLNKFRKQFGKTRKSKNIEPSSKEIDTSFVKSETKKENPINESNNNINDNLEQSKEINKEKNLNEKNLNENNNNEIQRTNTLEEMFKKKIEDGFDTETNNILDLGKSHNNSNDLNILNEIQDKLGINFNDVNTNNANNDIKENINTNNINQNDENSISLQNENPIIDSHKSVNIFDNVHDSKKFINPDDRPIHPSTSKNFNFELDFDEQEKLFNKQDSNNKEKTGIKTKSSRPKNFFDDKDLEELGKLGKNTNSDNNKKYVSAEIENKTKHNNEVNPFDIENNLENSISSKAKDEKDINNINNAINKVNNAINNLEHLNKNKKRDDDERRPKIKIEDFQKKLELALEQEQTGGEILDLGGNNDNNGKEKDNEKSDKYIEDPRFDNIKAKLGKEIVDSLMSKKWESKKHGYELINNFLESNSLNDFNPNDLYEYIRFKLKNFKETNFNVNREAMNVFITMVQKKLINKENLISIIVAYYDKITDSKLKDNYLELFKSSLSILDPSSILKQLLSKISKKNNAKLFIEYSLIFGKIIEEYYNKELPYKELTDFCKVMANNNNPQSRNSATNLICILYRYYGEEIHKLIKDIKESTLKNIESELSKITVIERKNSSNLKGRRSSKKLTIENKDNENMNLNGGGKEINGAEKNEKKSHTISDISKKITPQILKCISDGKWAEKKDACEQIEKILCDANMKILPNGLNDLMNLIKKKLIDGNKNIVRMMVCLLTQLIEALKQGFKQWSKYMALNLIPNLSDKNQILRNECQICFDKWVEFVGFDSLIIFFPPFLKNDNVEIRTEIMNFIKKYKNKFNKEIGVSVFKEMVENLLLCLQDRTASVRTQAEEIIKFSLNYIKINNYYAKIKEYKPAITNDLKIILDKIQNEINANNSVTSETNTNSINISNTKDSNKNNDDFDIENESNININEIINSNNNKKNGNGGATTHSGKNSNKKKDETMHLKSNSSILNNENSDSRKLSLNSGGEQNKKFKKIKTKARGSLNSSTISQHKSKDKNFNEKANKTKDLSAMKGSFKTCSNFNKKKNIDKDSLLNKSAKKEPSNSKIFKSTYKNRPDEENKKEGNNLSKSIINTNIENPKSDRASTTKKLAVGKIKGISNSLILKKEKTTKKEGNTIFISNVKVVPNKIKRLEKDLKFKFSLDNISKDISVKTKLKEMCKNLFTDEFIKKIFCEDFKKQVIALKEMKEQLDKKLNIPIYFDNLDLILKILGIHLNGNLNPTLVKNLLEFFDSLYIVVNEKGQVLTEIESTIIISLLIDKLSINNKLLKDNLIKLLTEYIELNEINRIMISVLNFALGKNSKIKTEILDFTIELYSNKKLNIMTKNYVKLFGKYLCSNDNLVKSKVLILLKAIFSSIGEELFVLLDFLTDKDKKFLENNLFEDNDAEFDDEEEEIELDKHNFGMINSSDEEIEDTNKNENINDNPINQANIKDNNIVANGAMNSENELLFTMNNLLNKDLTERINAIILFHEITCQKYQENKKIIIPNIDNIVNIIIKVTHELFISSDIFSIPIKFAKYLATVLLKITSNKELISKISYKILYNLTIELLSYLLIGDFEKIGENQEGNFIFKSINSSMLRVIDNCDKTSVILVFLEILKNYQKNDDKMGGLAIKCLLKSTENLNDIFRELNINKIFNELHLIVSNYEKKYPDLKNKNQNDTFILRFIRNFICNITKLKQNDIMEIYNNTIKKSNSEDKYIIHWIQSTLENLNENNENANLNQNILIYPDNINNKNYRNNKENNAEIKKEQVKNENNNDSENNNVNNNNENNKVVNTIDQLDQLKKKWNDVKIK